MKKQIIICNIVWIFLYVIIFFKFGISGVLLSSLVSVCALVNGSIYEDRKCQRLEKSMSGALDRLKKLSPK